VLSAKSIKYLKMVASCSKTMAKKASNQIIDKGLQLSVLVSELDKVESKLHLAMNKLEQKSRYAFDLERSPEEVTSSAFDLERSPEEVTSSNNNLLSDLDAVKANNALFESKLKDMEDLERNNAVL
jgi:hypothetical protein